MMSDGYSDMMDELRKEQQAKAPHADHYRKMKPEPIEVIEAWGLDFHRANALKYISRAPYKGSKKADIEKAIFYLQRYLTLKEPNEI